MAREIYNIINDMADVLNASQMRRLQEVLIQRLSENRKNEFEHTPNDEFLEMYITTKSLEGCTEKTIHVYRHNVSKMLNTLQIPVIKITTEDLRSNQCYPLCSKNGLIASLTAFFITKYATIEIKPVIIKYKNNSTIASIQALSLLVLIHPSDIPKYLQLHIPAHRKWRQAW